MPKLKLPWKPIRERQLPQAKENLEVGEYKVKQVTYSLRFFPETQNPLEKMSERVSLQTGFTLPLFCGFSHEPGSGLLASSLNGESALAGTLILCSIGCCLDTLNNSISAVF